MSQLDPVGTSTSHFLKIKLNIILPSMPGSSKWSLSLRFPHQNPVYASLLPHTRYMPRPSNFITLTILREQYRSLSSSLLYFIQNELYRGHSTGEKMGKETSYPILMSCYSPDRTALLITSPKSLKIAKVIAINTYEDRTV